MLSGRSQTQKATYCVIPNPQTENRLVVAKDWERKEWGVSADRHKISFWGNKNVLELGSRDDCITL